MSKELFEAISSDITDVIDEAVDSVEKDFQGDAKEILEMLEGEVSSILRELDSGMSLKEVLKNKDTVATLYLAGTLSKLGQQETKAASAANDLLTSISFIVLKALLMKG